MYKIISFISFIYISLLLTSCVGDFVAVSPEIEVEVEKDENGFTFNDIFYPNNILLEIQYEAGDVELSVYGEGVLIPDEEEIVGESVDGLYFDFQFDAENDLLIPSGTYTFSEDNITEGTFYGEVAIDYNSSTESSTIDEEMTSGTVTISKNADVYTFNYSVQIASGNVIGQYTGKADFIETP